MISAKGFRIYLKGEGLPTLYKIERELKIISFNQLAEWDWLKLSLSHFLNTLYFEMLDFMTGLEQELKEVGSKTGKVLVDDLKKDTEIVLDLREEVLTTGSFTNKELFALIQQQFLNKIENLRKVLQDHAENLETFEQELTGASVLLKRAGDYILQSPEMINKIRQKINAMTVNNFLSQKEGLASNLEYLSEKIEEQYQLLRKLQKVSALKRVLASLQLAKGNVSGLAKTVRKTDPIVWKESAASFEVFREHLLKDLEGTLKIFAVTAEDLQDARKQLAA